MQNTLMDGTAAEAAAPPPRPAPVRRVDARADGRAGFRLLVVDDDIVSIQQLGRLLGGYASVSFATSGDEALAMATAHRPDLILLDAEMPGVSGFDVLKKLQAGAETARIPVIFVTSHATPDVEAAVLRMGAADFVGKPVAPAALLARIRCQLQRGSSWAVTPRRARPRLLIVDDDAGAIQLLRHLLDDVGDCHFALDGRHALRLAATLQPDLVLLDVGLPDLDGFAICEALRRDEAMQHVPVVFVTQAVDAAHEVRAFATEADDYIRKPYPTAVLLARVRRLVERKLHVDADLDTVRQHWQRIGEARVAEVTAAAADAIVSVDSSGLIVLANAACHRLLGVPEGQAVGRRLADFLPAGDAPAPGAPRMRRSGDDGLLAPTSTTGHADERTHTLVLRAGAPRPPAAAQRVGDAVDGIVALARLAVSDADVGADGGPSPASRLHEILAAAQGLQDLLGQTSSAATPVAAAPTGWRIAVELGLALHAASAEMAEAAVRSGSRLTVLPTARPVHVAVDVQLLHQCLTQVLTQALAASGRGGVVTVAAAGARGVAAATATGAATVTVCVSAAASDTRSSDAAPQQTAPDLAFAQQLAVAIGAGLGAERAESGDLRISLHLPRAESDTVGP